MPSLEQIMLENAKCAETSMEQTERATLAGLFIKPNQRRLSPGNKDRIGNVAQAGIRLEELSMGWRNNLLRLDTAGQEDAPAAEASDRSTSGELDTPGCWQYWRSTAKDASGRL